MIAGSIDLCIGSLLGTITPEWRGYVDRTSARDRLVTDSGVDLGFDGQAWLDWYRKNKPEVLFARYKGDPPRV
jgi:hypothetical protein